MITVRATCPLCGDVKINLDEVKLAVAAPAAARDRSFYQFVCKGCGQEVAKHASEDIIAKLTKGGVTTLAWTVPAEAYEGRPQGQSLTWDDVLDFRLAIANLYALSLQADPTKELRL